MKTSLWTSIISILFSQLMKSEGNFSIAHYMILVLYNLQYNKFTIKFKCSHFLFILVAQCTDVILDIINEVNADVKDNGQLFICSNDTWFSLCSTKFDSEEAQAACRQLGYVDGSKL